jgi:putative ABC transport system permease protein
MPARTHTPRPRTGSGAMGPAEPLTARTLMRPRALGYLYLRRLRVHAAQEALAGLGVAIAVALVFAATVANESVAGSASEVVHAVVGPASLQLRARGGEGFDERLLARVEALPGVKQAAPLLEATATVRGPHGRSVTVELAGAETSLVTLDGLAETLPISAFSPGGIGLSRTSAQALGVSGARARTEEVTLDLRGRAQRLRIAAVLGPEAFGALSQAHVAVMPLARLQRLAGLQGRITRILVQTEPGREAAVRTELQRIAAGTLDVQPADQDVASLRQALRPSDQASAFFTAVCALLGFLFAFNAMLLTVPERRRAIADLRLIGTRRATIVEVAAFQALCLGIAASLVGLLGGYLLSLGALHQPTAYLAEAFTIGSSSVVELRPLLLALAGGILATCLASAVPLLDLRPGRALDAVHFEEGEPGNALGAHAQRRLALGAGSLVALSTVMFILAPSVALLVSAPLLALATVLAVPLMFAGVLRAAGLLTRHFPHLSILPVSLTSLKATTLRSLALAATGAVALFGAIALGGARADLLRGIEGFSHSYAADAAIWVTNPADNQATVDFRAGGYAAGIARLPGVAAVRSFQGGFLQLGGRRVWVIARPPGAARSVLASQIVKGSASAASERLGAGGWAVVSQQIAEERHVGVGDELTLPTPTGNARLRIAATSTNLAWPPGVIFLGSSDYRRLWATAAPTALGVQLRPGASATAVRGAIAALLARSSSGLEATSAPVLEARIDTLTSEGLSRLGQISTLLLLAAILAMAAALTSAIWQRRASLAGLRLSGAKPGRLRKVLLLEVLLMLGTGCLTGTLTGLYGQVVIDGYLRHVTGFPVAGVAAAWRPLGILGLVTLVVVAIVAIPGWLASRVSPALALEE